MNSDTQWLHLWNGYIKRPHICWNTDQDHVQTVWKSSNGYRDFRLTEQRGHCAEVPPPLLNTWGCLWIVSMLTQNSSILNLTPAHDASTSCWIYQLWTRAHAAFLKLKHLMSPKLLWAPSLFQLSGNIHELKIFKIRLHIACIRIKCSVHWLQNNSQCIFAFHLKPVSWIFPSFPLRVGMK